MRDLVTAGLQGTTKPGFYRVLRRVYDERIARTPEERLQAWASSNEAAVEMATQMLGEIWESERFTFTTLSVALRAIRTLVATTSLPQAQ